MPISGSADMAKDLGALVEEISAAGIDASAANVVFIASAAQAMTLALTSGPHFDYRVLACNSVPAGTVIAIAVSALVIAGDGANPRIDTAKQTTLNYAEPAAPLVSTGGVEAAPTISTTQTDTLALRCTSMITWSAAPGAVAVATGATW